MVAAVAAAFVTALGAGPSASARPGASCTYEQQQARRDALVAATRAAARARAAYFRAHKNTKARAAFVKRQQAKLRTLRAAAGCKVPPLPLSSAASCAPALAPYPGGIGNLSEAPIAAGVRQPAIGRVDSVALFFDYPDAPGGSATPATISPTLDPEPGWFREVSQGRLTVTLTPVPRWIRMPAPLSSYLPFNSNERLTRYMSDAIAAADPFIDFSRYNHVTLLNAGPFPSFGAAILNGLYGAVPPSADGVEVRYGVFLPSDATTISRFRNFWLHEQLHVFGLPDLGGRAVGWDPTSYGIGPPDLSHLLGWHKWQLRWIDAPQITCLEAPGTVEETLTPIAAEGGKKLVVALVNASLAYAVEVRRWIDYDRNACEEGVVVYSIDSQRTGYQDPIVLRGPLRCGSATPGALRTGDVYEDDRVRVEVLATDGRNERVRVTKK